MVVFSLIERHAHTQSHIPNGIVFHTEFNTLHVGVVNVLPLIGVAQSSHGIVSIGKLNFVVQFGAKDICAQLDVVAIIIGRDIVTHRLFSFQIGRLPHTWGAGTQVKVLTETIRSAESGTEIGAKGDARHNIVLHSYTRIHTGFIKFRFGEGTVEHSFARFIFLARGVGIQPYARNHSQIGQDTPFVLCKEAKLYGVLLAQRGIRLPDVFGFFVGNAIQTGLTQAAEIGLTAHQQTMTPQFTGEGERRGKGIFLCQIRTHGLNVRTGIVVRRLIITQESIIGSFTLVTHIGSRIVEFGRQADGKCVNQFTGQAVGIDILSAR